MGLRLQHKNLVDFFLRSVEQPLDPFWIAVEIHLGVLAQRLSDPKFERGKTREDVPIACPLYRFHRSARRPHQLNIGMEIPAVGPKKENSGDIRHPKTLRLYLDPAETFQFFKQTVDRAERYPAFSGYLDLTHEPDVLF
jgi:hypothetical protein